MWYTHDLIEWMPTHYIVEFFFDVIVQLCKQVLKKITSLASQTASSSPFLQIDVIGQGGRVWWIAYTAFVLSHRN